MDVTLVSQYIYYASTAKPSPPYPGRLRSASAATITRRMSIDRPPTHYRALSNVAANVAAAAALVAQQEEQTRWHAQQHHHTHETVADGMTDDDDVDEGALARLADSFHSEGGRSAHRKTVSWSRERGGSVGRARPPTLSPITHTHRPSHVPPSPILGGTDEIDILSRGRPLSRDVALVDEAEAEWTTTTAQRRSSRASRKGAGMVFLGAWMLFGVGTFAGSRRDSYTSGRTSLGRVIQQDEIAPIPLANLQASPGALDDILGPATNGADHSPPVAFDHLHFVDDIPPSDPPEDHGPSTDYIIGRISAWICTTLYLTSRLPQIWKNVRLPVP